MCVKNKKMFWMSRFSDFSMTCGTQLHILGYYGITFISVCCFLYQLQPLAQPCRKRCGLVGMVPRPGKARRGAAADAVCQQGHSLPDYWSRQAPATATATNQSTDVDKERVSAVKGPIDTGSDSCKNAKTGGEAVEAEPASAWLDLCNCDNVNSLYHNIIVGLFARISSPDALPLFYETLHKMCSVCRLNGHKGLTVGSGCTGSGCPELWLKKLADFVGTSEDISFNILFQCEEDPAKRQWLSMFQEELGVPGVLFNRMSVLSQAEAVNMKTKEQVRAPVLPTVLFLCGFSCRSVSVLALVVVVVAVKSGEVSI